MLPELASSWSLQSGEHLSRGVAQQLYLAIGRKKKIFYSSPVSWTASSSLTSRSLQQRKQCLSAGFLHAPLSSSLQLPSRVTYQPVLLIHFLIFLSPALSSTRLPVVPLLRLSSPFGYLQQLPL